MDQPANAKTTSREPALHGAQRAAKADAVIVMHGSLRGASGVVSFLEQRLPLAAVLILRFTPVSSLPSV